MTLAKFLSANNPSDPIPQTADVIIIGGGPAGAAAAWALEQAQPGIRTLLVERASTVGAGSSRASLENFRTCWPCAPLAKMMQRSVDIFIHADDYFGEGTRESIHLRQQGYLWCALTERDAATLRADVQHLHGMDIHAVSYLDHDEVTARFPWLGHHILAAKYDPTAGWLDSNALIQALLRAATHAQVFLDAGDVRLRVQAGCVVGVETAVGFIAAPRVILAAGAWSVQVAQAAGLTLPVVLRPRQSFTTGWRHEAFPDDAPTLIGAAPFPHVRPEARSGAIFGWEYRWHRKHAQTMAEGGMKESAQQPVQDDVLYGTVEYPERLRDARFPSLTLALLARQFGHAPGSGFADPRYLRSVRHNIGYYVYRSPEAAYRLLADGTRTPYDSERAILDVHPDVQGLVLSIAHVGHGIMSAPCGGEIVARATLGLPPVDGLDEAFRIGTHWVAHDENAL